MMLPILKNRHDLKLRLAKRRSLLFSEIKKVTKIINRVKRNGDTALKELTRKYDKVSISKLKVSETELVESKSSLDSFLSSALGKASNNIRRFHQKQIPKKIEIKQPDNTLVTLDWRPVRRIGIYIPGGRFPLFSSVLMTVIPAQVAGVSEIVICSPPTSEGLPQRNMLGLCAILGIKEVYSVGGAQAIAALAYGTESISPVDKIIGPGNIWVSTAKYAVSQDVGIDKLAGPTELVIVADETSNPDYIAADLISQAEHDPEAWAILLTDSVSVAEKVDLSVSRLLTHLPTKKIAEKSLTNHGFIYVEKTIKKCIELSNKISPEHLSLQVSNPDQWIQAVIAGAIFLGPLTSITWGDYWSGANHVLPTSGQAKVEGPLSVFDFLIPYSIIQTDQLGLTTSAEDVICLAKSEGLNGHALAVEIRR